MVTSVKQSFVVRLVLTLSILLFMGFSARLMWASAIVVMPEDAITQWEKGKTPFDLAKANRLAARLARANAFNDNRVQTYLLQARLHLLIGQQSEDTQALQQAVEYANTAMRMQPSDFQAWAVLALAQHALQPARWEDQQALAAALTIAPFEKTIQIRLLPLTIGHWSQLSQHNKQLAMVMIKSALLNSHTDYIAVRQMIAHNNIVPFMPLQKKTKYQKMLEQQLQVNNG